jgi:type IV pilus assembly protein PilN
MKSCGWPVDWLCEGLMIKVNFLPWRESLHQRQRRNFIYSIVLNLLIVLIVVTGIYYKLHHQIEMQINRNKILYKFNDKLRSKKQQYITMQKQRNLLIKKLRLIVKIQRRGEKLVQVLQALFGYVDNRCWLDTVVLQDDKLVMKFITKNYDVSDSITKIFTHLDFLTRPQINMSADADSFVKFTVNCFFKQAEYNDKNINDIIY